MAETKFFDWVTSSNINLSNNNTNYVYVKYNSGSPHVTYSTSVPSDKNTNVMLGLVYKDSNHLHMTTAGQIVSNVVKKDIWKDIEINGKFQRANGMVISETGTRNISTTTGVIYAGLTRITIPAFDSSGTDKFSYCYRDGSGGWIKVTDQTQIDNVHYDDGSGTLAEVSTSSGWRTYYGVHWVYMDSDGHVFVVYGQGNYLIEEAQDAQPPSSIPELLSSIGGLIGKIIIERNANTFESIQSAFDTVFTPQLTQNHNTLAGLQGGTADEYYHLSSNQYTVKLPQWDKAYASAQIALYDVVDDISPTLGGNLDVNSNDINNISNLSSVSISSQIISGGSIKTTSLDLNDTGDITNSHYIYTNRLISDSDPNTCYIDFYGSNTIDIYGYGYRMIRLVGGSQVIPPYVYYNPNKDMDLTFTIYRSGSGSDSVLTVDSNPIDWGVGINTETPSYGLHVNSDFYANIISGGSLRIGSTKITEILDEDNMTSDDASALATQQSIKAYVDTVTSDYLINNGDDTTSGTLTAAGFKTTGEISGSTIRGLAPMTYSIANIRVSAQQNINLAKFKCPTGKKVYVYQAYACNSGQNSVGNLKIELLSGSTSIYSTSSATLKS